MPTPPCHVLYCEGWDTERGRAVGVLEAVAASARDETGDQYAVLVRDAAGAPLVLLEIAWAHGHCGVWVFDGEGLRRTHHRYAREEDGGLALTHSRQWADPVSEEAASGRVPLLRSVEVLGGNWSVYRGEFAGGGHTSSHQWLEDDLASITHVRAPAFGRWEELAALHPLLSGADVELRDADVAPDRDPAPAPWAPPGPLVPLGVDGLFQPGRCYRDARDQRPGTVEVHDAGTLVLPTGRVLLRNPQGLGFAGQEQALSVPLPVGEHPVRVSVLRQAGPGGESAVVAGLRVDVADLVGVPVDAWEMALRPGESLEELREGRFHGVDVDRDSGLVSVCDAACLPHLVEVLTDPDTHPDLVIGYTPRERETLADRERELREAAQAFLDAPGTLTGQEFAEAISPSLEGDLEFRQSMYTLVRLAHGVVHTQDPGPARFAEPGERARDTGPWTRTLSEPVTGGNLVTAFVGDRVSSCPVWLGRAADGRVAALLVDTLAVERPAQY
ncbi:DUF4241 domain-containing protein [Nocardiopsis sp. NRRL B-16309]|uniref:DUF4241 domain-containing protein n=1 Tax=Nocardiopsis sp. NRRL B-16309 TaxID=1519494 RepID=UPI0006B05D41|nr:DUF4241 domain-containing protein [Nocardiopsis sp. NRRL B-16309]KOX12510.1 hypothetical protein ADL05_21820 [Nocardiopsis sp. NRRL B-16309]